MNALGETIDSNAKRLYITTRGNSEVGLFLTGETLGPFYLDKLYCVTLDRVIVGLYSKHGEAEMHLQKITDLDIGSSKKS